MRIDGTWQFQLDVPAGAREATVRLTAVGRVLCGSWHENGDSKLFDGGSISMRTSPGRSRRPGRPGR